MPGGLRSVLTYVGGSDASHCCMLRMLEKGIRLCFVVVFGIDFFSVMLGEKSVHAASAVSLMETGIFFGNVLTPLWFNLVNILSFTVSYKGIRGLLGLGVYFGMDSCLLCMVLGGWAVFPGRVASNVLEFRLDGWAGSQEFAIGTGSGVLSANLNVWCVMRLRVSTVGVLGCLRCLLALVGFIVLGSTWICFCLIILLLSAVGYTSQFQGLYRRCSVLSFGEGSSPHFRLPSWFILVLEMLTWLVMLVALLKKKKPLRPF